MALARDALFLPLAAEVKQNLLAAKEGSAFSVFSPSEVQMCDVLTGDI